MRLEPRNVSRRMLHRLWHLWGTLFGAGRAEEVSLCSTPPPPPAAVVGSYNHHDIGEEVEWRPPEGCCMLTP